jgi:predicted Zn-dependent protease
MKPLTVFIIMVVALLTAWAFAPVFADQPPQRHRYEFEPEVTAAYTTFGKWAETCFTWVAEEPEVFKWAIDEWAKHANVTDCGNTANPEILMFWDYGITQIGWLGWASMSGNGTNLTACTIGINANSYLARLSLKAVMAHELGHCFGLGHSEYNDQLMSEYCCAPFGADDIAGIQALYGPPLTPLPPPPPPTEYKYPMPGISKDGLQ